MRDAWKDREQLMANLRAAQFSTLIPQKSGLNDGIP
jgi:hypothetical protein